MQFISSAIKIKYQNQFIIFTGFRHYHCLELMHKLNINRDKKDDIQGFIVLNDDGNEMFVDRFEGARIATELGYKLKYPNCLFSEDIWP
jgi:hypothetical protein